MSDMSVINVFIDGLLTPTPASRILNMLVNEISKENTRYRAALESIELEDCLDCATETARAALYPDDAPTSEPVS